MAIGNSKAADALAPAGDAKRLVVGIKVKFELNSKNGLRRVVFGLEKDTQGDDVQWKINFELYERDKKSDPYSDPLVSLDVEVDTKLASKADGLTPRQAAHALGPAADDAKGTTTGDVDEDDAKDTVQATLKKK